jgi:hypothetical protein
MPTPLERTLRPNPVDAIYRRAAKRLEERCPGWTVVYERGYKATSPGQDPISGTCAQAIEAQIAAKRRR